MVRLKITPHLQKCLASEGLHFPIEVNYSQLLAYLVLLPELLQECSLVFHKEDPPAKPEFIKRIEERRKERQYQQMVRNVNHFSVQSNPELSQGMGMAMSFVSVLFLGGLSGYYLGKFFGLEYHTCMVLCFIMCVISLYVEVILFLMKPENKPKTQ